VGHRSGNIPERWPPRPASAEGRLLVDYHPVKVVAVVLRDWLKKLLGRSGSVSAAEEARVKHQVDSEAIDRYAGRVMGVYGDIGPTVPSPESPPDRPLTD
jgi:hypothetical protein